MRLMLVLVLVGCSHSHGPSWPKASTTGSDGGESLAPHEARVVVAVEASPDETPSAEAVDVKPAKPASAGIPITPITAPAVAAPPTPDEPLTTEDIVIEIDGND